LRAAPGDPEHKKAVNSMLSVEVRNTLQKNNAENATLIGLFYRIIWQVIFRSRTVPHFTLPTLDGYRKCHPARASTGVPTRQRNKRNYNVKIKRRSVSASTKQPSAAMRHIAKELKIPMPCSKRLMSLLEHLSDKKLSPATLKDMRTIMRLLPRTAEIEVRYNGGWSDNKSAVLILQVNIIQERIYPSELKKGGPCEKN